MPDILARRCGSTPSSWRALIMWLVIELCPHPAHRVVAAPLYASRGKPTRFMVALMRGPRKIEDFVAFSCGHRLRFQKWFDDRVSRDGLPVVMTDRPEPADQCRRERQPDQVIDLPVTVLLDDIHAVVPRHKLFHLRRQRQRAHTHVIDAEPACR